MNFIYFITLFSSAVGMIAYDCGTERTNVTTISLLDVEDCDFSIQTINETMRYIQLLQINEFTETNVIQCKIEIHRTMYYCGMHSHISIIKNGEANFIKEISQQTCEKAHETGVLRVTDGHVIHGLKVNNSISHGIIFAGSVASGGSCSGTSYFDPYGSGDSVVVQGTIKITLMSYHARVHLNTNQIYLRSGVTCSLSRTTCLDHEGGQAFWRPIPVDKCKFNQYGVLYEGYAHKLEEPFSEEQKIIYSVNTQGITFALSAQEKETFCGYTVIRTEHPKLVIFETEKGNTFVSSQQTSVANLDLFTYMNSKFVYVEKHIRHQMKQLYRDVVLQRCLLERETLKNTQALVYVAPDRFAYNYMNGPGYMAVAAGEVVHLIKCTPVEVKMQHGTYCYGEVPVQRNNASYYMTPITRILKKIGTKNECNPLLPPMYKFGSSWVQFLPNPSNVVPPAKMKPSSKMTWKYVNPKDLAISGIYTEGDLESLKNRLMYPLERPSLLNNMARELDGRPVVESDSVLNKIINENTFKKMLESTWERFWNRFTSFGTISAGLIGIYIIFGIFKSICSLVIRGYTLHGVYGCSLHLLGALWSALTHLLLYLGQRSTDRNNGQENIPIPHEQPVVVNQPVIEQPINHNRINNEQINQQQSNALRYPELPRNEGFFGINH